MKHAAMPHGLPREAGDLPLTRGRQLARMAARLLVLMSVGYTVLYALVEL